MNVSESNEERILTNIDKDAVERDCVADLADHLCARRPCGDTPENVADWLAYSLERCGLKLEALTQPTERTDDAVVERVAAAMKPELFAGGPDESRGPGTRYERDFCRDMARRAIAAMPTEQTNKLEEAVEAVLAEWEARYPLSVFPEPDLSRVAELLIAGGITLDAVSASNMRSVVSRMAHDIRAALAQTTDTVGGSRDE
jgi:hypothetical protein